MAGLLASVRVLFAKNWRIKQRESRLNQRRPTTPGAWLFPPLITDVILPLALLLYFLQFLCDVNTSTVNMSPTIVDMATRRLMPHQTAAPVSPGVSFAVRYPGASLTIPTTASAVTAMTALPLLLTTANLSLVTLDRPENLAFLEYLDRVYSGDETLGIVRLSSLTKIVSAPKDVSANAADSLLETFPKNSRTGVYAGLDIRRASPVAPFEARVFFNEDDNNSPTKAQLTDQIAKYFTVDVKEPIADGRTFQFPGPLVLQMEMNRFLRKTTKSASSIAPLEPISPQRACRLVDTMLDVVGLWWQDFPPTSQLGGGEASCEKAIKAGEVGPKTLAFLAHFVDADASLDTLRNLNVNQLPKRPRKTVAGQLDGNIVFFMVYLFLWPFNRLVRDVVLEKEKQLKEYLLIMGLAPMALLVSWFLVYLVASVAVVLLAVVMLSGEMFAATYASQAHFFMLLMVFATSMLLFGLAITPMFSSARTAAAAGPLVYLALSAAPLLQSYLGDEAVEHSALRYVIWFMRQFSAPVVFMETLHSVTALDAVTTKVQPIAWETVAGPSLKIIAQSIGYLVLGWYLENVFPRAFGVQRPWYFVGQPSYWFPNRFGRKARDGANDDDELVQLTAGENAEATFPDDETMREMPMTEYMHHFRPILLVKGLSKRYPNGKLAVNNVSFGVKKGEIFGLLGPNGAGKSTTMSIVCGMLSPTTGDAFVGANSVAHDPLAIRKSLSVCFQQNILWDDLTVWDHLQLVYNLKTSLGIKAIDEEMWMQKLKHFGLDEKRDALSKTLSGGQKRKLSLVLALMDTSRVVLLDEPTAGMDLKARVDTWDALRKAVNHRAVILTTHSMQEAQALCENIGIVAEGRLKCCGSSLFLREKFGVGYKLTVVHADAEKKSTNNATAENLLAVVKNHVSSAVLVSENKWETRVQLNSDDPAAMLPIFHELEDMKQRNIIKRYAVAATDLEDVFVRVTEGGDVYHHVKESNAEMLEEKKMAGQHETPSSMPSIATRHSDIHAIPLQLRALLSKRWKLMVRDKRAFLAHYIWPLVSYVILLAIATGTFGSGSLETLTSLPTTASHSSLLVGTLPGATTTASHIYDHIDPSIKARIRWQEVATAAQVLDIVMHNDTNTPYFAAVLIRNATLLDLDEPFLQFSIYYNETIQHSMPVALEWLSMAYCKSVSGTAEGSSDAPGNCELSFTKSAFPRRKFFAIRAGDADVNMDTSGQSNDVAQRFLVAFYVLITMSSISANYITAIVKEKEMGLKRLQYLHLASEHASKVYWLSHLVYDYMGYLVSIVVLFLITAVYHLTWPAELMVALVVQTVVFGLAVLAFSYLLSLAFSSHSSAQSVMSYIATFQVIGSVIVFTLSYVPSICAKASTAAMYFRVLPLYAYAEATLNLVTMSMAPVREQCVALSARTTSANGIDFPLDFATPSPWDWSVGGRPLAYMAVSFIAYMVILIAVDAMQSYPTILQNRLNWLLRRQTAAHAGVYRPVVYDIESPSRDIIEVQHLSKVYNPKKKTSESDDTTANSDGDEDRPVLTPSGQVIAVDDVSFVVERNDCVALLGVNGSGKSTTFEVLTSGIAPTSGSAFVDGIDVTLYPQRASRQYGYCPQTNVQFAELSVREHLALFYRLRTRHRFADRQEDAALSNLMTKLDLYQVEHTTAGHLSGGNKRRLMLALSLLSDDVSLLLMDEPSAGVDVVARRLMWKVLYDKRQNNRDVSCLFTTHSMEEAEAVCANAVVLNKGKLVWNGSIPELKQHAAAGISITLRLDTTSLWEPERVRYYVDKIRGVVARNASGQQTLYENKITTSDLLNAWRVCHDHHPRTKGQPATNDEHQWISALIARIEHDYTSAGSSANAVEIEAAASMDVTEFVQEWLLREAFATIESKLFQEHISARSGEPVKPVSLHDAMGSGTRSTAVYETNCNANFALVDAFTTLETHKAAFAIARYSISELSLERVFEQFT